MGKGAAITVVELEADGWRPLDLSVTEIGEKLGGPGLFWVDVRGDDADTRRVLEAIVGACPELAGVDPSRASKGGLNPPRYPPKAKVLRECVFARAYWLGARPERSPSVLAAQELHIIAARTFAITMRFPALAWHLDEPALEPHEFADDGLILGSDGQREVSEFRNRMKRSSSEEVFGLEVAAVVIDQIIDSVFDSLDAMRDRADVFEAEALDWVWAPRRRQQRPTLDERMLGLRRLLRQVRWAFMPSDEIAEFCSGPFIGVGQEDPGIDFRFTDLGREADRAVSAVKDVTDQVQHTVDLIGTKKADRLNDTMYVLTAVATVLLVPAVIAGIYGMNFSHMPELNWRFGYLGALVSMLALGFAVWFGIRRYLRQR